jgi:hypothetical protein
MPDMVRATGMHAFGVDDTLQLLVRFSFCLDVDQFSRAQVVWFWEVLKRMRHTVHPPWVGDAGGRLEIRIPVLYC